MNTSDADYFVQSTTQVSFLNYPDYENQPSLLFTYLSGLLTKAINSGEFSRYLRKLSRASNAVGTSNATCIEATYEHQAVIYPATFSPSAAPVSMTALARLGSAEMAGIIIAALMLTFMLALALYTVIRHVGKINKEQNLVKKYSFSRPAPEPLVPQDNAVVPFTLKDSDLDKLEYVGDTAKI